MNTSLMIGYEKKITGVKRSRHLFLEFGISSSEFVEDVAGEILEAGGRKCG